MRLWFLAVCCQQLAASTPPSTFYGYKNVWQFHLAPRCTAIRLRDFRTVDGEQLLQTIVRQTDLAKETIKQIKSLLSAVFKHARLLGFIDAQNPMRDVSIPNCRARAENCRPTRSKRN